ncbi:MAG: peptidoglycan DD-metalloendopeptidase family protein, partial [Solirubrobacterales bacterium]|nr:peptidoglycan DD-metalloendopeptidase family protein [Solirubrobacterales bacterium]
GGGANGTPAPGGKAGSTVTPALGKNCKMVKPGFNVRPGGVTGGVTGPDAKQGLQLPTLPQRNPDGTPTNANPTLSVASFGPAPLGVPNFIIDQFEIPPFLLPIYQACGTQYGIPWQVLASINRIETAFGTNLNVSTAGAVGWMQFLPSTWKMYGVDANGDGTKDPYNPVDAICAAGRYLKAAGGSTDLRQGIFAYNHADWYVDEVLLYAKQYGKLPDDLVGSLTGLTEGAHFPVAAKARYADDISEREAIRRSQTNARASGNAADVITSSPTRRSINIYSKVNAPVVAVNDGVIKKIGETKRLGKFMVLEDAYGNRYTYAQLGSVQPSYPVPKQHALTSKDFQLVTPKADAKPGAPASAGSNDANVKSQATSGESGGGTAKPAGGAPVNTENLRSRLFANPQKSGSSTAASPSDLGGQVDNLLASKIPGYETFKGTFSNAFKFDQKTMELKALKVGSKVTGGTVLGQVGPATQVGGSTVAPHLAFAIRPAGRGAPSIDPKPILDGWKLLESTAIYRDAGQNPFATQNVTIGQVLLMDKASLEQRVLADPRLEIYACGRTDIETGQIDRRPLAVMEYLAERGYRLTITSLKCGHSLLTTSGNVSAHSSGNAVDIAQVNGIPILGHQGPGSITEDVIKDLLKLQGTMRPAQIISLMDLGPPTFILPDHADHIHVGYTPTFGDGKLGAQLARILKPQQWERLIGRLGQIKNPQVPTKASPFAVPVKPSDSAGNAHIGD